MTKVIPLLFLKFAITQITFLITFEEFNRIIKYSHTDFNYVPMGPYLLKSSKIPKAPCHQFYDPSQQFVQYKGKMITNANYMKEIAKLNVHHNQMYEVPLVAITLLAGLVLDFLGFIVQSDYLVLLDNLFTLLLPNFGLFINTVSWGDECVEESLIFSVMTYQMMVYIGMVTLGGVIILILLLFLFMICDVSRNSKLFFAYICLVCIFILYLVGVGIVNIYCTPFIVRILFFLKFGVTGFYMLVSNDIL